MLRVNTDNIEKEVDGNVVTNGQVRMCSHTSDTVLIIEAPAALTKESPAHRFSCVYLDGKYTYTLNHERCAESANSIRTNFPIVLDAELILKRKQAIAWSAYS